MDYFDDVFISFLDKDSIPYQSFAMEGQKTLGQNVKYLMLSEDERRSYGLGTT